MAKRNYTNLDLLTTIKLNCMVPVDQITFSDEEILFMASNELELNVLSNIMKMREEYYVYTKIYDLATSGRYEIPSRAAGNKIRIVYLKNGEQLWPCSLITKKEIPYVQNQYTTSSAIPLFYIENDEVVFVANTSNQINANEVQIDYYLEPNELVLPSECLKITNIDRNSGIIQVSERQIPTGIQETTEIDFIQAIPTNKLKAHDVALVSTSPNTPVSSQKFITVNADDIPDNLVVGDWIAVAGQSPVPQLVANIRALLAQVTACKILESQTDTESYKIANSKRLEMIKDLTPLIQDRTEGNPKKITSRNNLLNASLIGRLGRRRG
jgi:hypothetical protein